MSGARDRTTIRRALKAGGVAAAAVGVPLLAWALAAGADLVVAALLAGLTAGVWLAAGWLMLALGLDLLASEIPGGGRVALTSAAGLLALLMPFLLLASVTP